MGDEEFSLSPPRDTTDLIKPATGKTPAGGRCQCWGMKWRQWMGLVKPLWALVVEVGEVPLRQLLSQEGGGCLLLLFDVCIVALDA